VLNAFNNVKKHQGTDVLVIREPLFDDTGGVFLVNSTQKQTKTPGCGL